MFLRESPPIDGEAPQPRLGCGQPPTEAPPGTQPSKDRGRSRQKWPWEPHDIVYSKCVDFGDLHVSSYGVVLSCEVVLSYVVMNQPPFHLVEVLGFLARGACLKKEPQFCPSLTYFLQYSTVFGGL